MGWWWLQWREMQGRHLLRETGGGNRRQYRDGSGGGLLHICFYAILLARSLAILRNHDLSALAQPGFNPLDSARIIANFRAREILWMLPFRRYRRSFQILPLPPPRVSRGILESWRRWPRDLCLNLFTDANKTHQIRPEATAAAPSAQLTAILFVFTYRPGQR